MQLLGLIALAALPIHGVLGDGHNIFHKAAAIKERFLSERLAQPEPEPVTPKLEARAKSPYLNKNSKKFVVDGTGIPEVNFDIGESYAGLLPISDDPNETRQLYFWFFPSQNPAAKNEIGIWLNGGPGCSSLSGLLTENGPFLYQAGTLAPTPNPYAWNKLTNYVWIEQPVGTGFSQGKPNITNEIQLSAEFKGFWKNFVDTFAIQGSKIYITGESYAGMYVPYIANSFLLEKNTKYFNLKGIAINDPVIGDDLLQTFPPAVPYLEFWNAMLNIPAGIVKKLQKLNDQCGFTNYTNTYFTFPPPQKPFPAVPTYKHGCDVYDPIYSAAIRVNPCFNIYHISDTCPFPYGHLGIVNTGDYSPPGAEVYFNRQDVKKAINAPLNTHWYQCSQIPVFLHGDDDTSPRPGTDGVLQNVVESTNNVIVGSGGLDFLIPTNGTLFALQNMTWNGYQGFKTRPSTSFIVPNHKETNKGAQTGSGPIGYWGSERGLTFYEIQLAGHEVPGYSLGGGYRFLEVLLGRVPNLSSTAPLTGM